MVLISAQRLHIVTYTSAQINQVQPDTIRVIFENGKMKVTEYVSNPGKDVCGKGKHGHPAHLNIAMTNIKGRVTGSDGKTQTVEVPMGATFWSEADTHVAINNGDEPARLYIIEEKKM